MKVLGFLLMLALSPLVVAERFDVNECIEPGVLDLSNGQVLGCWQDITPPSEPPAPPSGDIDPSVLNWNITVPGGPFDDCGLPETVLRSPSPSDAKHVLEDVSTSGWSSCIQDIGGLWPYYMRSEIVISGHDKEVRFSVPMGHQLIIRNADRIAITGSFPSVVCENSSHVSYNGERVQGCSY